MRSWGTPVPIPNTMVKTWTADGTLLETARESRWMPPLKISLCVKSLHRLRYNICYINQFKSNNLNDCWNRVSFRAYSSAG